MSDIYAIKDKWTCLEVLEWLRAAAVTDRVMKSAKVDGYRSFWPAYPDEENTAYGYTEEDARQPQATSREATIWFFVCQWGVVLDNEYERDIVWSRARRVPYKVLERRHHCSRWTINRDMTRCMATICAMLNAKFDFHAIGQEKIKRFCYK